MSTQRLNWDVELHGNFFKIVTITIKRGQSLRNKITHFKKKVETSTVHSKYLEDI